MLRICFLFIRVFSFVLIFPEKTVIIHLQDADHGILPFMESGQGASLAVFFFLTKNASRFENTKQNAHIHGRLSARENTVSFSNTEVPRRFQRSMGAIIRSGQGSIGSGP